MKSLLPTTPYYADMVLAKAYFTQMLVLIVNSLCFVPEFDGIFLSNGPGDPSFSFTAIENIRKHVRDKNAKPLFGICLGHQLLSLAIGCNSFKMK